MDKLPKELLGMIFLYLDYPDLLRKQRVCEPWRGLIVDEPNMKVLLYQEPELIERFPYDNPHFDALSLAALEGRHRGGRVSSKPFRQPTPSTSKARVQSPCHGSKEINSKRTSIL
ncbi:hypothetical protein K458DRAFT_25029 [Lentithecium fluviatile CBS 122367]|uniref:F-box domain-containing protein n=1 Tax=Lentithecium fluviatile CBS 122367 TaxID=1168545 RepID=A0A6G1J5F9_9PLEO|nr:hypothetical protein K458DRAFT_25029 [Lentithecium fluviatile CBS 122367]